MLRHAWCSSEGTPCFLYYVSSLLVCCYATMLLCQNFNVRWKETCLQNYHNLLSFLCFLLQPPCSFTVFFFTSTCFSFFSSLSYYFSLLLLPSRPAALSAAVYARRRWSLHWSPNAQSGWRRIWQGQYGSQRNREILASTSLQSHLQVSDQEQSSQSSRTERGSGFGKMNGERGSWQWEDWDHVKRNGLEPSCRPQWMQKERVIHHFNKVSQQSMLWTNSWVIVNSLVPDQLFTALRGAKLR